MLCNLTFSVLRKENAEIKSVLNTQKERASGQRIILKGKFIVTTEPIHRALDNAEQKTRKTLAKGRQRRNKSVSEEEEIEEQHMDDDLEPEECEIQDCIAVQWSK